MSILADLLLVRFMLITIIAKDLRYGQTDCLIGGRDLIRSTWMVNNHYYFKSTNADVLNNIKVEVS